MLTAAMIAGMPIGMKRLLPTGTQDFGIIRRDGLAYVDKTSSVHRLITRSGRALFLSRPRRFGKSLLCSTIASVFAGDRELFGPIAGQQALAIDSLEWEWKAYPVIKLDFSSEDFSLGMSSLDAVIRRGLQSQARRLGIELQPDTCPNQLFFLVEAACIKAGERVVVVIDEYDAPLLGSIGQPDAHERIRTGLGAILSVLKVCDEYLRFVFVTGITKFSKVGLFSTANQLTDISFNPDYADICGITQEELESNFGPEIDHVMSRIWAGEVPGRPDSVLRQMHAQAASATGEGASLPPDPSREEYVDELRGFYNGYRFSTKDLTVYNPYGIIRHFDGDGIFEHYWYESGSPRFLVDLVREGKLNITQAGNTRLLSSSFHRFNPEELDPSAVLYQAGYLTIADFDKYTREYLLDYPNTEVRSALAESLMMDHLRTSRANTDRLISQLIRAYCSGNIEKAMDIVTAFLASIPYAIIKPTENYYETAIFLIYQSLGLRSRPQYQTSDGRIDTVVETDNYVYCFEYKLNQPPEVGLAQIDR
ncbi:MAG: ATP-binding protein, partial [Polyangiaceae bacterium]|nr:ATP-binding protein [Polyangiaceae bacterium]